jgi:dethiobiotin synthetase
MRGLFVTGTDTGVGKTVVTVAIVRLLRSQGWPCRACKPVATGAIQINGRWVSEDTETLARSLGQTFSDVTSWAFAEPAAPPVAARLQGCRLELNEIVAAVQSRYPADGAIVVEGVGGLLCPLTENSTVADLIGTLGLPVVVVCRRSLGTLNHTLLTLEAARSRKFNVVGVVMTETTLPSTQAEETNVAELQKRIAVPILGVVSYQPTGVPDATAALAGVDWWELAKGTDERKSSLQ